MPGRASGHPRELLNAFSVNHPAATGRAREDRPFLLNSPSMKRTPIAVSALLLGSMIANAAPPNRIMAALFMADRVYVDVSMPTHAGVLRFYTDTGGSLAITADAATRAHFHVMPATDPDLLQALGPDARVAFAPALPPASLLSDAEQFVVLKSVVQIPGWPAQADGILGQAWFGGHVWTWDYPRSRLILRPPEWVPQGSEHPVPVTFKTDSSGHRDTNFPRIVIRIDGEDLPMLFDTGAETFLTPSALQEIHDGGPRFRATSMIMHSVFVRWHTAHPEWPVVDAAQVTTGSRMIRIPFVEVGGLRTGPVWFTERPDNNFLQYMSAMTSAPVSGSAGGNIFHDARVTLDYIGARMWIEVTAHGRPSRHD